MITITRHSGFHITFANGWTASVQFGPGNYCEHYGGMDFDAPKATSRWESTDAEVAAWPRDGKMVGFDNGDTVIGRLDANAVLAFLNDIAAREEASK